MFLFVKPCQLRVNGCFSHYGLIYTPGFSSFSCRPSNFFPGCPSEFFHLPRSSVRPNFPQVFNLIFSDAGYRPAATFLSVSLHPGFEEWVCFWFSLSWYDKTFINLVLLNPKPVSPTISTFIKVLKVLERRFTFHVDSAC